jgi:hypothetical protein
MVVLLVYAQSPGCKFGFSAKALLLNSMTLTKNMDERKTFSMIDIP